MLVSSVGRLPSPRLRKSAPPAPSLGLLLCGRGLFSQLFINKSYPPPAKWGGPARYGRWGWVGGGLGARAGPDWPRGGGPGGAAPGRRALVSKSADQGGAARLDGESGGLHARAHALPAPPGAAAGLWVSEPWVSSPTPASPASSSPSPSSEPSPSAQLSAFARLAGGPFVEGLFLPTDSPATQRSARTFWMLSSRSMSALASFLRK